MESHGNLLTTVVLVAIWLLLALKVFRFDKLASTMFNGTFAVVIVSGMLVFAFAVVFGLIGAAAQWVTGDEQIGLYIGLAGATLIAALYVFANLPYGFGWDDLAYLVKEEIPARIREFLKIKVARETEGKNTSLLLKLANQIVEEEKSSGWYYFLATIFFIGTYFFLKDYEHSSLYFYLEYMDWWRKTPLLVALYALFMLFYRWIYRSRFIKAPFTKIVALLEVLERGGQYMAFYDEGDGEYYGICSLEEKPPRYPNTPWNERFVDIGDGELGYLLSSTMDYFDFRRVYLNIKNGGVKGYLQCLQQKEADA